MISFQFGMFPLMGIIVGLLLFAIYYYLLRMECKPAHAQNFIFAAVIFTTVCSFVTLARIVEPQRNDTTTSVVPHERVSDEDPTNSEVINNMDIPPSAYETVRQPSSIASALSDKIHYAIWIYGAGICLVIINLLIQVAWYIRLRGKSEYITTENKAKIFSTNFNIPFSFGRSIFIPKTLDKKTRSFAISHEKSHLRHGHFKRLCLMQLLLAVGWYNPFMWLFFKELKLQQEMEVDADILSGEVDREDYQMSILSVCVSGSRWLNVGSAFGAKHIKQRIRFMNKDLRPRNMRRRWRAALATLCVCLMGIATFACQINQHVRRHPLEGAWTMDFTRPSGSDSEYYPPFKQYAFYSHDTFFTPHLSYREGIRFGYGFSGEEVVMHHDTLVNALGKPLIYRFVNENTFQCDWTRKKTDRSLVTTDVVTDQWSRCEVPKEITLAFVSAYESERHHERPLDGVWQIEDSQSDYYLLANDTLVMAVEYSPDPDSTIYRYFGNGFSGIVNYKNKITVRLNIDYSATISDAQRLTLVPSEDSKSPALSFRRLPTIPGHIRRMLSSVVEVSGMD